MPITFGSVGDIIAVCALVKDCADALSATRGSAAEYQAVVRELNVLEKSLLEIGILAKTYASTPHLKKIFQNVARTVDNCRKSIKAFDAKIKPYGRDLGDGFNGSTARKIVVGTTQKIRWQMRMKGEVARFRAEVVAHSMSIDQLLAAATLYTVKSQSDKVLDNQDKSLKKMESRLKKVNRRMSAENNALSQLVEDRAEWLAQLGKESKEIILKIMVLNLATFAAVDKIQKSIQNIEQNIPTLTRPVESGKSFYLEDALGRRSTITLDFITSWEAFVAVLEVRFQGKPGLKKVLKKEFAIQNRVTGKDVEASKDWESTFLPGLWFDMDMIFQERQEDDSDESKGDTCPRCRTESNQPPGLQIRCSVCKQWYQRLVEIGTDDSTRAPAANYAHAPDAPDSFATAPPVQNHPVVHPVPPSHLAENGQDNDYGEGPASFNRVRIKAQIRLQAKDTTETPSHSEPQDVHDTIADHLNDTKPTTNYESDDGNQSVTSSGQDTNGIKTASRASSSSFETPQQVDEESENDKEWDDIERESRKETKKPATGPRLATEADALRVGIPVGYSIKHWDPDEEPILLLGSVFDANSLGKWIYDWTAACYGRRWSPQGEVAGELWLLLIKLAGNIRRAEDTLMKIKKRDDYEMVEDFLESGERLWIRFAKLIKKCEDHMWNENKRHTGKKKPEKMSAKSGIWFVDALLSQGLHLEETESWMYKTRLWGVRFDANCEDILRDTN